MTAVLVAALIPGGADASAHELSGRAATTAAPTASSVTSSTAAGTATSTGALDAAVHDARVLALQTSIEPIVAASGATVGLTFVELGATDRVSWSLNAGAIFTAASTYKLAALMMEAENIATGATDPNGLVCFEPDDYEAGWFDDYSPGACYTRSELASRAAQQSDNTAGHMLVRDLGGAGALNAWAASVGASSSSFFDGNTTTPADLAVLWAAEAAGSLGGAAAQAWLYPLLTGTATEDGVPAGVPGGIAVVHKTGTIDAVDNDAALVTSSSRGAYVLVVMEDGLPGAAGWQLIAGISATVWQFESS